MRHESRHSARSLGCSSPHPQGVAAAAHGTAWFMLHRDTGATVFAVYGRWGLGKSTFMKLVEKEMLVHAAKPEAAAKQAGGQLRSWVVVLVLAWRWLRQAGAWAWKSAVRANQAVWMQLQACAYWLVWQEQEHEQQPPPPPLPPLSLLSKVVFCLQALSAWLRSWPEGLHTQLDRSVKKADDVKQAAFARIEGDMDSTDAARRTAAFARCRKIARPRVITVWFNAW